MTGLLRPRGPLKHLSGIFYRIVPLSRADDPLAPAVSLEGRFHHAGQAALYLSSRQDWAEHAIARYVQPDDPPRVFCEIEIARALVLDLRDGAQCAAWGADPALASVPWLEQRALGARATTWGLSDLARQGGAQGMIYTARSCPSRWHLVLFDRLEAGATLRATGQRFPYPTTAPKTAP